MMKIIQDLKSVLNEELEAFRRLQDKVEKLTNPI